MTSKTVKRYALTDERNVGSTKLSDYITRDTREELVTYQQNEWDTPIVEVDVTFNFPEPELPTTPGSLIRATLSDITGIFVLTADDDDIPWYSVDAYLDYVGSEGMTNIEVLFDAATVSA